MLLFDEPTAALDPEITGAKSSALFMSWRQTHITQVIVTHEVEVARKTASRVVYMENGHIVEQGDDRSFNQPQTERLHITYRTDAGYNDEKNCHCRTVSWL